MAKIKLRKPITVGEGAGAKTIDIVDLDKLEELTGADVLYCRREAMAKTGTPAVYGPLDDAYRLEVAAKVSGIGAAQLTRLSLRDFEAVDRVVKNFLLDSDSEEPPTPTASSESPA